MSDSPNPKEKAPAPPRKRTANGKVARLAAVAAGRVSIMNQTEAAHYLSLSVSAFQRLERWWSKKEGGGGMKLRMSSRRSRGTLDRYELKRLKQLLRKRHDVTKLSEIYDRQRDRGQGRPAGFLNSPKARRDSTLVVDKAVLTKKEAALFFGVSIRQLQRIERKVPAHIRTELMRGSERLVRYRKIDLLVCRRKMKKWVSHLADRRTRTFDSLLLRSFEGDRAADAEMDRRMRLARARKAKCPSQT